MISRYSIETPPYARGRLVEDENGKILKLDEAAETLNSALFALQRARNYKDVNPYLLAEIDSAMLAIRDVIEAKEPVDHVY